MFVGMDAKAEVVENNFSGSRHTDIPQIEQWSCAFHAVE